MALPYLDMLKAAAAGAFIVAAYYGHRLAELTEGGAEYWNLLAIASFMLAFSLSLEILAMTGIFGQDLTGYELMSESIKVLTGAILGYAVFGMHKLLSSA